MKHEFFNSWEENIKHICKEQKKGKNREKNIGKQQWTEKNLNKIRKKGKTWNSRKGSIKNNSENSRKEGEISEKTTGKTMRTEKKKLNKIREKDQENVKLLKKKETPRINGFLSFVETKLIIYKN